MAIIDDTYRNDRPEAGPTGQGFGAMASPGYFSRAAAPTQLATTAPIGTDHTAGPVDALTPRPTGPTPPLPDQYDPDAGAMVPQSNVGGAFSRGASAVGGTIQNTFNSMAGTVGTGFVAPAQAAETVAPSAQTARGPVTDYAGGYPDQVSRSAGSTPGLQTGYQVPPGPISGAASQGPLGDDYRPATVYPNVNVDDARARNLQQTNIISSLAAQEQRQVQERNAGQIAQANAANAGQAAERAAGEARVANFRATNGADVVLAGGNQAYNAQRQGIINGARSATEQSAIANKAAIDANTIAGQPVGNPVQDNAATQDTIQRGEQALRTNKTADIQNQLGAQQVEHGKATQGLLARLSDPNLSPKDRQAAQQSYLVSLGKDPAQYKVEHSNGPPVLDSLGQLHPGPQYVHIVNTTTGEVQTMKNQPDAGAAPGAGRTPLPDHVAMLKSDPKKYSAMFDQAYGPGAAAAALGSK